MKGKIAFVVGAAVGYVLGSRAGRERYEQIKRGAQSVWQTEPVQRGVSVVRDKLDDKADDIKAFVRRASSDVISNIAKQASGAKNGTSTEGASSQGASGQRASAQGGAKASPTKAQADSANSAAGDEGAPEDAQAKG